MKRQVDPNQEVFLSLDKLPEETLSNLQKTAQGILDDDKGQELYHYGTPRHSGRYPWGSGDNPYQRNENFLKTVDELKKKGLTEKQIAEGMGMNTSELRKRKSLANAENRSYLSAEAKRLKAKGMSTSAIARRMGRNESSVRLLLDEGLNERMGTVAKNATILKERVENLNYIDVGKGSEQYLGITGHSLGNALHILEEVAAEDNTVTRHFSQCGLTAENAMQSQALLHLYSHYCRRKRCLKCSIGIFLLRSNKD